MSDTENTDSIAITPASVRETEKPQIDLQALAERVFRLMKQEARIQKERQAVRHPDAREVRHAR